MHTSGSLIRTAIEDMRVLLNEATLDSKYPDQFLVRTALGAAMAQLFTKASQVSTERIFIRMPISIVAGQQYYNLPPCVEQVHCIRKYDDDGKLLWDWRPRNMYHRNGPAWTLEHRTLSLFPIPQADEDCELWYTPSGHFNMHYSEDGEVSSATAPTSFTLSAAPTLGLIGKGENEYVGHILRSLDDIHAERVISGYTNSSRVVSLRTPLPNLGGTTARSYEVVPAGMGPFWSAAASLAALRIGVGRKIDGSHYGMIVSQHKGDLKALRDSLNQMNSRFSRSFRLNTIDNPDSVLAFERPEQ